LDCKYSFSSVYNNYFENQIILKRVVILGAGESGVGAALLAKQEGYEVFVSDRGSIKENYKKELTEHTISFEEGKHTIEKIFKASVIIKSPGIPDKVDLIKQLKKKGIEVISEIEFAARHTKAYIIGITGSNGKTTTTKLTHHLLKTAGLNAGVGGNIGYSFSRLLTESPKDIYVLELSSFQLDGIVDFRPDLSILLNITPDHLDRYEYKMENYIQSKFRIILNHQLSDTFIFNAEDENITDYMNEHTCMQKLIPIKETYFSDGKINIDKQRIFDMSDCSLKGPHNLFNSTCAIQAALKVGALPKAIQEGLNNFVNAPHRLELVATINGVDYINDSKATNVDSVYVALKAMTKSVIWIAGGTDKGNDYSAIEPFVQEKVKALICMGVDNSKLIENFSPVLKNIEETKSVAEAVERASVYAEDGDVILLSPACASFDLFKNYIDRGDQFREAVLQLK